MPRPRREREENPHEILRSVGLRASMTLADVGCGNGFFSIPAAEIVTESGRVLCVDISREAMDELEAEARRRGLGNVTTKVGRGEDTVFCTGCVDLVFYGIVLHDFQDPLRVLSNAKRMLNPDGHVVNLDWKKVPMDFGPPHQIRFDVEEASSLLGGAGFEVDEVREEGDYHYLIIARPTR